MRSILNRLWVRLALTFISIFMASVFLPAAALLTAGSLGWIEFNRSVQDDAVVIQEEMTEEDFEERFERRVLWDLTQFLVFSGFTGIIAGVYASRRIARHLSKLEAGAREVGARNLNYRVEIDKGSEEIITLADSFNQMASELEQGQKLRQNLLADVAHELRTPLTVLQGNLRGILDDVFPLDKEEVGRLFDQTRHLTRLVNDLHELAQAEGNTLTLNKSQIDVPNFLQDIAAGFRPMSEEKGIALRVELLGKLPTLYADKDRLQQSLNNLISNAIRYTPDGGQITIRAGESESKQLVMSVIDSGEGIDEDHLPHVFDRFYRTDPSRQRHEDRGGTGLGLAIVKAIAENHGGQVNVSSSGKDQGSAFTIALPLR